MARDAQWYRQLDPSVSLYANWRRLAQGTISYPRFRAAMGECGGIRAKRRTLAAEEWTDEHVIPVDPTFTENEDGATAYAVGRRITTLEALLDACQVDRSLWDVDHHLINTWEVGINGGEEVITETLFQVKAWLKPRLSAPYESVIEAAITRLEKGAPKYPKIHKSTPLHGCLMAPQLYDMHFNSRNQSPASMADTVRSITDEVCSRALGSGMDIERILLPVGNDVLHQDNLQGQTSRGTWVETYGDIRDAIDAVVIAHAYLIDRLSEIAPVDIVTVESNHDRLQVYYLGKILQARFHNHPHVTVTITRGPRHYYQYGTTLIGLHHGDNIKADRLALVMATEAPRMWAATTYREWWQGHLHKKQNMLNLATEELGVLTRIIPALSDADDWHRAHGFVGNHRRAEILYYHREYGPAGSYPVFVDNLQAQPAVALAA